MKRRAILALIPALPAAIAALFMRNRRRTAGGNPHWTTIMGGSSTQPAELAHGFATAVIGGMELDLRQATLGERPATLDVAVLWGGVLVRVPDDWQVTIDVQPTMGGVRDFRPREAPLNAGDAPDLIIVGSVVMGGLAVAGDVELADIMREGDATA